MKHVEYDRGAYHPTYNVYRENGWLVSRHETQAEAEAAAGRAEQ